MEPEDLAGCLFHEPEKFAVDPKTLSEAQLEIMARNRQTLALVVWEPYMQNPKLKHRLHLIDRPTLMLRGDHDGLVSREYAEAYAGLIPGAVLETVPGAGHAVEIEKPDAFVERIVEWANG
jgi:pimeloyl-ACP methyl ester carboxylesterase